MNSNLLTYPGSRSCYLPKVQPMDFNFEYSQFIATLNLAIQPLNSLNQLNSVNSFVSATTENARNKRNRTEISSIQQFLTSNSLFVEPEFKLAIELKRDFQIFKGKYFSFKVCLIQLGGTVFPANEIIELETSVYTSEDILITKNMKGQEIIKGNFIQKMNYYIPEKKHVAHIKIQITEVSSHFIDKKLNLKVKSRNSDFLNVTGWKIQSASLSGITVKAKKTC